MNGADSYITMRKAAAIFFAVFVYLCAFGSFAMSDLVVTGFKTNVLPFPVSATGLRITSFEFNEFTFVGSTQGDSLVIIPNQETTEERFFIAGKPYNYPNPFGIEDGSSIGYELSRAMDIELKVFNILGHLVHERFIPAGFIGGRVGYNKVPLDITHFNGQKISPGVYFFFLFNNGKILGKGKMIVTP